MRQRLLTSGSFCCVGKRERNNKTLSKYCILECREAAVGSGEGGKEEEKAGGEARREEEREGYSLLENELEI